MGGRGPPSQKQVSGALMQEGNQILPQIRTQQNPTHKMPQLSGQV